MHFTLREKFLIMLFCISMVVGICGSIFGDIYSRSRTTANLDMFCRENARELDSVFADVGARVDTIAYEAGNSLRRTTDPMDRSFIDEINSSSEVLLRQVLDNLEGHCYVYLKYNQDLMGNEGIFFEKTKNEIKSLPLTDLSKYDKNDAEHVGWYYLPVEYGSPVWLEPYHNKNVDTYMISYVYPVYHNGEFYCLYGVDLDLNEILYRVRTMKVGSSGSCVLYDKAGNPLGRIPAEIEADRDGFVSSSQNLKNGMTLVAYISKDEIYAIRRSPAYKATASIYILLLIGFLSFALMSIRSKNTEENKERKKTWLFTVGVGIALILMLMIGFTLVMKVGVGGPQPISVTQTGGFFTDYKAVIPADMEPYSFIEANGKPDGYSVEIANAVANDLMANIDVQVVEKDIALNMIRNGEADMMVGLDSSIAADNPDLIFTEPIVSDYVCVYGKIPVSGIGDILKGSVAYVRSDDFPDVYGILDEAQAFDTYKDAIESVSNGTNDFFVGLRPCVQQVLIENRYSTINEVYLLVESQICMAVNSDHKMLSRSLNAAIADIRTEGLVSSLHEKWLENRKIKKNTRDVIVENRVFYEITFFILVILIVIYQVLFFRVREDRIFLLSETDSLTGIYNRRGGERRIKQLLIQRVPGAFVLLDVDKFKTINDTYGHLVGDKVLTAIGDCMKNTFRSQDICMRMGGDEYAVYISNVSIEKHFRVIINRFFNELQGIDIPELHGRQISVSVGAILWSGEEERDYLSLYEETDKCTYESKKYIGNHVTIVSDKERDKDEKD